MLTASLADAKLGHVGNVAAVLKLALLASGRFSAHDTLQLVCFGTFFMLYAQSFCPEAYLVDFDLFITDNAGSRELHRDLSPTHFNSSISFSMISPNVSSNSNSRNLFLMQNKTKGRPNVTNALDDT